MEIILSRWIFHDFPLPCRGCIRKKMIPQASWFSTKKTAGKFEEIRYHTFDPDPWFVWNMNLPSPLKGWWNPQAGLVHDVNSMISPKLPCYEASEKTLWMSPIEAQVPVKKTWKQQGPLSIQVYNVIYFPQFDSLSRSISTWYSWHSKTIGVVQDQKPPEFHGFLGFRWISSLAVGRDPGCLKLLQTPQLRWASFEYIAVPPCQCRGGQDCAGRRSNTSQCHRASAVGAKWGP